MSNSNSTVMLPKGYTPSSDEPYMCTLHFEYFRQILLAHKAELMQSSIDSKIKLQDLSRQESNDLDKALLDNMAELEISCNNHRERQIKQIDHALQKIQNQDYGYCEITNEEIGLSRLKANPTALYCIEAQEQIEAKQRFQFK